MSQAARPFPMRVEEPAIGVQQHSRDPVPGVVLPRDPEKPGQLRGSERSLGRAAVGELDQHARVRFSPETGLILVRCQARLFRASSEPLATPQPSGLPVSGSRARDRSSDSASSSRTRRTRDAGFRRHPRCSVWRTPSAEEGLFRPGSGFGGAVGPRRDGAAPGLETLVLPVVTAPRRSPTSARTHRHRNAGREPPRR